MTIATLLEERAEVLFDIRCSVGESPVWDVTRNRLWWVDAGANAIWWADMDGSAPACAPLDIAPSFIALSDSGVICVAAGQGWHAFDPNTRCLILLAQPAAAPTESWRMNDGTVDAQGRIWTGSIGLPRGDASLGALFRFSADGVHLMADDLLTQNGLAVTPDGKTLYLADSHPSRAVIWAYDLDPHSGHISNRRVFHRCDGGRPDGAAMDVAGGYWFALIDGGQIVRLDPSGAVTHRIPMSVSHPTNLCFGGPDMTRVFVTSMRASLSDADMTTQPLAGGVFSFHAPFVGALMTPAGSYIEPAESRQTGRRPILH